MLVRKLPSHSPLGTAVNALNALPVPGSVMAIKQNGPRQRTVWPARRGPLSQKARITLSRRALLSFARELTLTGQLTTQERGGRRKRRARYFTRVSVTPLRCR